MKTIINVNNDRLTQVNTMCKYQGRQADIDRLLTELNQMKRILSMSLVEWLNYTRDTEQLQKENNYDHT